MSVLARALAHYPADEDDRPGQSNVSLGDSGYTPATVEALVNDLSSDLGADALEFFELMVPPPHEVGSTDLAGRTGLSASALSGRLVRPLRQAIETHGLQKPWDEGGRRTGKGSVWVARDIDAVRLIATRLRETTLPHEAPELGPTLAGSPSITAVFPFAPEYTADLDQPRNQGSSCLRDTTPGSRAVIYQVHRDQALIAIFDATDVPERDRDWGWYTNGHYEPIPNPIPRDRLLVDPVLRRVFANLFGRRHLDRNAQHAMSELLAKEGGFPDGLPPHVMQQDQSRPRRRRQH
jgi:hypothetical protein